MGALTVEDRLERIERLLGVGSAGGNDGAPRRAGRGRSAPEGADFGQWLRSQHRPGHSVVAVGVSMDSQNGSVMRSSVLQRRPGDTASDLRTLAGLCQALASEARLAILRELTRGARTTADLVAATGSERSQLYHHLRDLFVQGLVEQPERGRYAATTKGAMVFLAADALPLLGDPAEEPTGRELEAEDDPDAEDRASSAASPTGQ